MDDKFLCYVKFIGTDINGFNTYEFLFTENIEEFWCENGEYKPCGLVNGLEPVEGSYSTVKELKTNITFDLIQDSTCFGWTDCTDKIIALAYENIDNYEEYPEPLRIVLHYGLKYDEVIDILSQRNLIFKED